MRTTIDIPNNILNQVLDLAGQKTKRRAILEALNTYIHQRKKKALLDSAGKIPMRLDIRQMRKNRDLSGF